MNEVEHQAADIVISRMEFLEEIVEVAQGHWNVVEYKVPKDELSFIGVHERLGRLLKQNRDADNE